MKFDFDKGWSEALAMIRSNFGLLATIAGVLIFLPSAFAAILFPDASLQIAGGNSAQPDMDQLQAAMQTLIAEYWWLFLVVFLLTSLAQLAMFAFMRRRASPTVGEALGTAAGLLPSFVGAYILQILALMGPYVLLVALPAFASLAPIAVVGALVMIPLVIYLMIKFSLTTAVIGLEGERNPVAALRRSWKLTKGNSFRLLGFYLLLAVAAFILFLIAGWVVGLVFSFGGPETVSFGTALFAGVVDALSSVFMVSIFAAIHAQLSRLSVADDSLEA